MIMCMQDKNLCVVCRNPVPRSLPKGQPRKLCGRDACRRAYDKKFTATYDRRVRAERIREGAGEVICQVCHEPFLCITWSHLKSHGLTLADYSERYPDCPVRSPRLLESLTKGGEKSAAYTSYGGMDPDGRLAEFLTGALLGDASLSRRPPTSPRARYSEGASNLEYLCWKAEILGHYFPVRMWERLSLPDKRTGKRYLNYFMKTGVHPFLGQWHAAWYGEHKVVPFDLVENYLTSFAFALWFCDDGHMMPHGARLYTQAFSTKEAERLAELLTAHLGIPAHVIHNASGQPLIQCPSRSRLRIAEILAAHRLPGMAYKYAAALKSRT